MPTIKSIFTYRSIYYLYVFINCHIWKNSVSEIKIKNRKDPIEKLYWKRKKGKKKRWRRLSVLLFSASCGCFLWWSGSNRDFWLALSSWCAVWGSLFWCFYFIVRIKIKKKKLPFNFSLRYWICSCCDPNIGNSSSTSTSMLSLLAGSSSSCCVGVSFEITLGEVESFLELFLPSSWWTSTIWEKSQTIFGACI